MSLFSIFDIAGSGMSAQSLRLNATASNIANAESVSSSVDKTYRARHPIFSAVMDEAIGFDEGSALGGVQVQGIVESQAPTRQEYQPDHPLADAQGYIYLPNVSIVEEMANMISASRSYQGNVEVMNASKQMLQHTLSLGR
jgi:flagellar basal-body rod protein FlgC